MNTKLLSSLAVLAFVCVAASMSWAQSGTHIMVTPTDLKWAGGHTVSAAGRKDRRH
jgi:hypothetical protein